ncbi:hypothetical protein B0H14DRAFT_2998680, partial [Mycena olivaceomarginata]
LCTFSGNPRALRRLSLPLFYRVAFLPMALGAPTPFHAKKSGHAQECSRSNRRRDVLYRGNMRGCSDGRTEFAHCLK